MCAGAVLESRFVRKLLRGMFRQARLCAQVLRAQSFSAAGCFQKRKKTWNGCLFPLAHIYIYIIIIYTPRINTTPDYLRVLVPWLQWDQFLTSNSFRMLTHLSQVCAKPQLVSNCLQLCDCRGDDFELAGSILCAAAALEVLFVGK